MKKLFFILFIFLALFFVVGCTTGNSVSNTVADADFTVYKNPNCGCCSGHVSALEKEGYKVNTIETNAEIIKDDYNIPREMRSCHTAIAGDYFIEGHVPIEVINKLLIEKPDIDGIALPGMPAGSPGMGGSKQGSWKIYALKDGEYSTFMVV